MLLNRLIQIVLLSTGFFLTTSIWASNQTDVVEKTPITVNTKQVSPTNNHFPGLDWHKQHPKKSFPGEDWKKTQTRRCPH